MCSSCRVKSGLEEKKGRRESLDFQYVFITHNHSLMNTYSLQKSVIKYLFIILLCVKSSEVKELVTQEVTEKCGKC